MAETDDMVSIFVLYHDDPAVDLQKVFWENKVLCVSGADLPAWSGISSGFGCRRWRISRFCWKPFSGFTTEIPIKTKTRRAKASGAAGGLKT